MADYPELINSVLGKYKISFHERVNYLLVIDNSPTWVIFTPMIRASLDSYLHLPPSLCWRWSRRDDMILPDAALQAAGCEGLKSADSSVNSKKSVVRS